MQSQKLPIQVNFRSSGYTEEEIEALAKDVEDFAVLIPRRQGIPEAGASFDIGFLITWAEAIGVNLLSNALYDLLKKLSVTFKEFFRRKRESSNGHDPDVYCLEFTFIDKTVRILADYRGDGDSNFLRVETLTRLEELFRVIHWHLKGEPLASHDVQVLEVTEPFPNVAVNTAEKMLFTVPWRFKGTVQMESYLYHPHARTVVEEKM
jgi:hypothetical protein